MQSTEFKLLRLFYYNLRKYLGAKVGRARNCRGGINVLAHTGTILSSYLRNRNLTYPPNNPTPLQTLGLPPIYFSMIIQSITVDQLGCETTDGLDNHVHVSFWPTDGSGHRQRVDEVGRAAGRE